MVGRIGRARVEGQKDGQTNVRDPHSTEGGNDRDGREWSERPTETQLDRCQQGVASGCRWDRHRAEGRGGSEGR